MIFGIESILEVSIEYHKIWEFMKSLNLNKKLSKEPKCCSVVGIFVLLHLLQTQKCVIAIALKTFISFFSSFTFPYPRLQRQWKPLWPSWWKNKEMLDKLHSTNNLSADAQKQMLRMETKCNVAFITRQPQLQSQPFEIRNTRYVNHSLIISNYSEIK